MTREIVGEKEIEKVLPDGEVKDMEEIERKDTDTPGFDEVEDVDKNSEFDPTSKNYNAVADRE